MKVLLGVLVGFFAGALVVFLLSDQARDEQTAETLRPDPTVQAPAVEPPVGSQTTPTRVTAPDASGLDANDSESAGLGHPGPPQDARPATLRRLADGDSFDITWSDTGEQDEVRLFGINAPEGDACFGQEARSVLDVLIGDDGLLIEIVEDEDDFRRVLGNVWVGDIFINATLVELGAALALSDGGQHARLITDAQERAESAGAGLWSPDRCGPPAAAALRIVWIESDAPGRDDQNKNGEWIQIANDGPTPVDMTGWSIRDESTRHRYSFPANFMLAAGAEVRVFSGCGDDGVDELYWCDADPVWNNGGDTGFLVDADGRFVDTRSY